MCAVTGDIHSHKVIIKHLGSTHRAHWWHFPRGSEDRESACCVGDLGSITELGRSPGEGNGHPLQYSCLGESHGQRSLVGYSR